MSVTPQSAFDVETIRRDFPILQSKVGNKPLVYLDNGASAQRPQQVLDRLAQYDSQEHSNIHRAVHHLSQVATSAYEAARVTVAQAINAPDEREVIFTGGTTAAINVVASSWGAENIEAGDEILLTEMEHHANIVPWQLLAERKGATIRVLPVSDSGELVLEKLDSLLTAKTKLFAFCLASNALGTINPAQKLVARAKAKGIKVLIDAAQAVAHGGVDVQALGCDFLAFSGHKVFGPTGIGVLWGKADILNAMPPYQGGGDMIEKVAFAGTTYRETPARFEAGTPNISGAIGLAAAFSYLQTLDIAALQAHEQHLLEHTSKRLLAEVPGLKIYGQAERKVAVISFLIEGLHPQDIGTMLDMDGIAIRTGHHCAMPLWQRFGVEGTCRASFAFYNTIAEADALVTSLKRIHTMLAG